MNESFENKIVIKESLNRYKVQIKLISTYHASINKIIKEKHQLLINILSILTENKIE